MHSRRITDLRHDTSRRRAVAGHRPAAGREGRDRRAARAARRRRDRGRLPDLVSGRLRGRAGRRRARSAGARSPRSHARSASDLERPPRPSPDARRSRIHVFIATSPLHMERKLRLTPDEVLETRATGGRIRHASTPTRSSSRPRTPPARNRRSSPQVCRQAIAAGATTRQPPGHGRLLPARRARGLPARDPGALPRARARHPLRPLPQRPRARGREHALRRSRAGATQVECTVNGIGERAGNAALEEVVMALRVRADELRRRDRRRTSARSAPSSALVSRLTGYAVQRNKAIVGANAFAHEAGIHQDGMLKDAATYQIMDPEELGLAMTLPLGKHSGRPRVRPGLRRGRHRAAGRRARHGLRTVQAARRRAQGRDPVRRLRGGAGPMRSHKTLHGRLPERGRHRPRADGRGEPGARGGRPPARLPRRRGARAVRRRGGQPLRPPAAGGDARAPAAGRTRCWSR